jgi:hypothetical protein
VTRDEFVLALAANIAARIAGDGVTRLDTEKARETIAAWSADLAERVWTNVRVPAELRNAA